MGYIPLYRLKDVPESENVYPEFSMFGELPAWGFYIRHVNGLTMKNISVTTRENDFGPLLFSMMPIISFLTSSLFQGQTADRRLY